MADIFQRKRRRRPLLLLGGLFFAVLAIASAADAFRGEPLTFGGEPASGWEAAAYRGGAALFCALVAGSLLAAARDRRRDEAERLLR